MSPPVHELVVPSPDAQRSEEAWISRVFAAARVESLVALDPSADALSETGRTQVDTALDREVKHNARMRAQQAEVHARLFGPSDREERIGRYVVRGTLGQGGMGRVLRVHDETLGRDVALKLLHEGGGKHEQRLLREAQALARLAHPNVVRVYDVQEIDGRLCMAMELVTGQSLRQWQETARPWPEVLALYLQAGRGLAAAHAEGLVHRDFKPANCIVDEQGVVKVLDFGLARGTGAELEPVVAPGEAEQTQDGSEGAVESGERAAGSITASASQSVRASRSQRILEQSLTRTGTMLGTVAYMAPEQLMGKPAGPASDQFSFCVALYEALYGRRPFVGTSAMATLYAIHSNRIGGESLPAGLPPVPRWLLEILRRGLAVASHQRYPEMNALLGAIERRLARRRRMRVGAVGAVLVVGLASTLALSGAFEGEGPCDGLRSRPMPAWTVDDRQAVRAAIDATDVPSAWRIGEHVEAELDAYAGRWVEARAEACEATWVRREAGEQALARRMACLDERVPHVRATVERLAKADARTAAHAIAAVDALPPLSACDDVDALLRGPDPVPGERAEDAERIRELVARSRVADATGDDAYGVDAAEEAVAAALALPEVPTLELEARQNRGHLYRRSRRFDEARDDLEQALALAERLEDRGRAIDVLRELILLADDEGDAVTARAWLGAIRGKLDLVQDDPRRRAQRWALEAQVAYRDRRIDDAVEAGQRAVGLYDAMENPPRDEQIEALLDLGDAQRRAGQMDPADATFERALSIAEQVGRRTFVGSAQYKRAHLRYVQGQLDEAGEILEDALAAHEGFFGERTVAGIRTRLLLAVVWQQRGDIDRALEYVLALREDLDERVPASIRGEVYNLLGVLHQAASRFDQAVEAFRYARSAREAMPSPDRVKLAAIDINLALCLTAQGQYEEAATALDRGQQVLQVDTRSDDPYRAHAWLALGKLELAQGNHVAAVPALRRVLVFDEALARDPSMAATAKWALARALRPDTVIPADVATEAARLAREARAAFEGAAVTEVVAEIDAWLERCGPVCANDPRSELPRTSTP